MSKRGKAGAGVTAASLNVETDGHEPDATIRARTVLRPTVNAALTVRNFNNLGSADLDLTAMVGELSEQCRLASSGDLGRPEEMLTAQAHALDAIFHNLAKRSARNMGEYLDASERYMRLALKAQNQCRATLETLATIKNPPMVIARQANIANGPQQVNNGEFPRAREIQSEPSKLLEQTHGERLDTGAIGQTVGSHPAMATVGAIHRPEDGDR